MGVAVGPKIMDLFELGQVFPIFEETDACLAQTLRTFLLATHTGCPKRFVSRLCGCCEGAVNSIDLLAILKKNLNRKILYYILKNFRMCTIVIEVLTPLNLTSPIKMYEKNALSRLLC